jgi:membrane associated rhomboid family serine protease
VTIGICAALQALIHLIGSFGMPDAHARSVAFVQHGTGLMIGALIAYFALRAKRRLERPR